MVGQADRSFYWPIFPVLEKTSGIGAFDPAYRCGAVPDLHRVPFRRSRWGAPPANEPQDRGLLGSCQSKCCVSVKVSERKNTIDIEFRPIWLVALRRNGTGHCRVGLQSSKRHFRRYQHAQSETLRRKCIRSGCCRRDRFPQTLLPSSRANIAFDWISLPASREHRGCT